MTAKARAPAGARLPRRPSACFFVLGSERRGRARAGTAFAPALPRATHTHTHTHAHTRARAGTSKVPLEGFRALQGIGGPQRFQIHKAYGPPDRLPSAHTCFNQLDLPEAGGREQLEERLKLAIREGHAGFGFA